jgi:hypothetical protein
MKPLRKSVVAAMMTGALLAGGAAGAILFGPHVAGAQTTTSVPDPSGATPGGSTFKGNEDPAHESGESAEREAAEDSGTFRGGGHGHGANEDPAHEKSESAEREAQEDAGAATTTTVP